MTSHWNPGFVDQGAAFAALAAAAKQLQTADWPSCEDLNRVLAHRDVPIANAQGCRIRFVPQALRRRDFGDEYEPRTFLRGEVQFRAGGWHDFFNALVWLTFPCTKAALNALHYHALERRRADAPANRAPLQDALTLFDESGVVVVSSDPVLSRLLREHEWKALFWQRRADVVRKMRFHLFGHGLAEKMLEPFAGVTGRGLILEVNEGFIGLPVADQLAQLDVRISSRLVDGTSLGARDFTPVPLLGIPHWCVDNEVENYYDNTAYFRPRRTG